MKVGAALEGGSWGAIPKAAQQAEALKYSFLFSSETSHNPFFPLVLAAQHTNRVRLQTSIAVAFSRSPMDMAYAAWDLQALSGGRFALGLGSQVQGHIVRRFGATWTAPIPRMREYVQALRAIWDCWQKGGRLEFRSKNYSLTLMSPFFNPGPIEHPNIRVQISAVNPGMLRLAGEVCDGVVLHPFNSLKYTRDVVLPNLEQGARKSGRTLEDLDVNGGGLIVTGAGEEEVEANKEATRNRIAFYASTPSYATVMNTHGWNDTAEKLHRMSVEGRWSEMVHEITDDMLEAFTVVGTYDDIVDKVKARYGSYATSIAFSIPVRTPEDAERLGVMIKSLQGG